MTDYEFYVPLHHEPSLNLGKIEISTCFQIPQFIIIGLANQEIQESKERVRSAIQNAGFEFPKKKITINLTPAHIKKQGTGFDLSIALAILTHQQNSSNSKVSNTTKKQTPIKVSAYGELRFDGELVSHARELRCLMSSLASDFCILPQTSKNALMNKISKIPTALWEQLTQTSSVKIIFARTLLETIEPLLQQYPSEAAMTLNELRHQSLLKLSPATCSSPQKSPEHHETDSYQLSAYLHRLIMLSITGHHHLMILGPRGIGKSHALQEACRLWKQVQATYSPMTDLEHDYLSELHSQEVPDKIRHVQSQIRPSGLLGTIQQGSLKPGELMLAHRGVLIADEFSEWHRDSRECLRDPLEKHKVTLHRSHQHLTVLTHFLMLATSNLCACGGSLVSVAKNLRCRCLPTERNHYFSRLSGPILDRIDLLVQLDYPQNESLPPLKTFQRSQSVQQIIKTQTYLKNRYETLPGLLNTEQTEQHLQTVCLENHEIQNFFKSHEKNQSLRSRHKCARLAFTLHALEQSESHSTSLSSEYSSPPTSTPLSLKHFYEAQFYQADHFLNQRLS